METPEPSAAYDPEKFTGPEPPDFTVPGDDLGSAEPDVANRQELLRAGSPPRCPDCGAISGGNATCATCRSHWPGGDPVPVLGYCPHGVNLDREFCPEGCRV